MNPKLKSRFVPVAALLSLAILACNVGGLGAQATPTPPPAPTPAPTKAAPTEAAVAPTDVPAAEPTTGAAGELGQPHTHPSGAFTLAFPAGWEVSDSDNYSYAISPTSEASMSVSFERVGVELNATGLESYIEAIETNYYGAFDNYAHLSTEPQADGSQGVFKTLAYEGTSYMVSTYYSQDGPTVFYADIWIVEDQYEALTPHLLESVNTLNYEGAAAESQSLYSIRYVFGCPEDFCEFHMPYAWTHQTSPAAPGYWKDRFLSPDQFMLIDHVITDNQREITPEIAAGMTDLMLKEEYQNPALEIRGSTAMPDDSVRVDWMSTKGDTTLFGQTYYRVRGNYYLALTFAFGSGAYDRGEELFAMWDELTASYTES